MQESDIWTASLDPEGAAASLAQPDIRTFHGVHPLDAQLGVWPKKTVPDVLRDPLFGAGRPGALPLNSFALLDAARAPDLVELLSNSTLDWCCLFTGKAEKELKDVAPYLVSLVEGDRFTRLLFTDAGMSNNLWPPNAGILLRSHLSMEDMRRHLRKFTRIQDDDDNWFYFRFWEIAALEHAATAAGADLAARLWRNCQVLWRSETNGKTATFRMFSQLEEDTAIG